VRNPNRSRFSRSVARADHYGEPRVIRAGPREEPVTRVISRELEMELLGHPGEWVATTRTELVAHGDDSIAVLAEARAKGVESPIIYRVPEPGVTYTFEAGTAQS